MKKSMILITVILCVVCSACGVTYYFIRNSVLLTITITLGVCFYHFAMRLVVGLCIDAVFRNKMNYDRWWFRERRFESGLYKILHVKNWKKRMPTFDPENFDIKRNSIEDIIRATCQAEVVHEIIMVLSFVPVVFTVWFGALAAFLITSCVAFCLDGIFVIMQRYNRPRLRRLLKYRR